MFLTKENIKALRARLKSAKESKFNIKQFAKILKRDTGTLRKYESGKCLPLVITLI